MHTLKRSTALVGGAIAALLFAAHPFRAQGSPPSTASTPNLPNNTHELLNTMAHAFNEIARKATPAVVSISTIKTVSPAEAAMALGPGMGGLPGMLGHGGKGGGDDEDLPDILGGGQAQQLIGIGSGVIIRQDGVILTNNHVVENADKITVNLDEKHKVDAKVIGTDPKTDLAVIQLEHGPKNLATLPFGSSNELKVGDWAIAIGSPFGLVQSMSFGIISATGRASMGILDTEDFIQTDAAINPGSSGGPLLNSNGEVIGINTAIFSQGGGFMGIGFAIPAQIAREVSQQLIEHGHVLRGWIGLMAQDMDKDLASHFKAPNDHGALVSDVVPDGPASKAELKPGDVVLKYDNHGIDNASQLKSFVGKTKAGSKIDVQILREGKPSEIALHVEQQPEVKVRPKQLAGQAAHKRDPNLGLAVEDLPLELARFLKLSPKSGVLVVRVAPGSQGFDAGLTAGDIILKINEEKLHGSKDFLQHAKQLKSGDVAVMYVQRGPEEKTFIPVKG